MKTKLTFGNISAFGNLHRVLRLSLTFSFILLSATLSAAQSTPVAHASVPFRFWLDNQELPAGTYIISSITETLLIFTNESNNATNHTYTVPVDRKLPVSESGLSFVLEDGKYVLAEVCVHGQEQRVTTLYNVALPNEPDRREVPITFTSK